MHSHCSKITTYYFGADSGFRAEFVEGGSIVLEILEATPILIVLV
jgi:hypothetical protein